MKYLLLLPALLLVSCSPQGWPPPNCQGCGPQGSSQQSPLRAPGPVAQTQPVDCALHDTPPGCKCHEGNPDFVTCEGTPLRLSQRDLNSPVLTFKHEDGWVTNIYCDGGLVQHEMNWYQFVTRCPH